MGRCPTCGEELATTTLAFCDQCGARLHSSGLLMLGASLGEMPREDSPAVIEQVGHPQRFVPFASWRALRAPR